MKINIINKFNYLITYVSIKIVFKSKLHNKNLERKNTSVNKKNKMSLKIQKLKNIAMLNSQIY